MEAEKDYFLGLVTYKFSAHLHMHCQNQAVNCLPPLSLPGVKVLSSSISQQ
jgi:hypothetical protein